MERETKKIKTPLGKELELKTHLTARERNELMQVLLKYMKAETSEGGQPKITELNGEAVLQSQYKLIELAVVSYDGNSEKILDRLLDGSPEEYDFAVTEANKIGAGNFQKAK